jgi:hypothetical protein
VSVDVPPGLGIGKGELARSEAHDGAVPLVHRQDIAHEVPTDHPIAPREVCGTVQEGPGDMAQRVEVEIIDDIAGEEHELLRYGESERLAQDPARQLMMGHSLVPQAEPAIASTIFQPVDQENP